MEDKLHKSPILSKIVHISDLHFGRRFDEDIWDMLRRNIINHTPNIIIVSGDIADNPRPKYLRKAKNYLKALVKVIDKCNVKLVCVPGNHDIGLYGNICLGWITRLAFKAYFELDAEEYKWWAKKSRGLIYIKIIRDIIVAWKKHFSTQYKQNGSVSIERIFDTITEKGVMILGFDSNYKLWLASGKVKLEDLYILGHVIGNLKACGRYVHAPRIGVLHHHPLPIPYVRETGPTNFEPFLILRNGGTFLRELSKYDFDIILHGHRHYSNFVRINFGFGQGKEMGILSAGSGTVRHPEAGRNSYNLITVYKNGHIDIKQYYYGGAQVLSDPQSISLFTINDLKARSHRRGIEFQGFQYDFVERRLEITRDGSAKSHTSLQGLLVTGEFTKTGQDHGIRIGAGRILHIDLDDISKKEGITIKKCEIKPGKEVSIRVDFGHSITRGRKIRYGFEHKMQGAFAMTKEEFKRKYHSLDHPIEYTSFAVRFPIKNLKLSVKFPEGISIGPPFLRVKLCENLMNAPINKEGELQCETRDLETDFEMQDYESRNLKFTQNGEWTLETNYPIIGYTYELCWELPGLHVDIPISHIYGETEAYQKLLMEYREQRLKGLSPEIAVKIKKIFKTLHGALYEKYKGFGIEIFSVTLMSYSEKYNKVVIIDGFKMQGNNEMELTWDFCLEPGVGNAGVAYEKGVPILYVANEVKDDNLYIKSDAGVKYEALLSIPLYHPRAKEFIGTLGKELPGAQWFLPIIGVMNIGSSSPATGLRRLKNEDDIRTVWGLINLAVDKILRKLV